MVRRVLLSLAWALPLILFSYVLYFVESTLVSWFSPSPGGGHPSAGSGGARKSGGAFTSAAAGSGGPVRRTVGVTIPVLAQLFAVFRVLAKPADVIESAADPYAMLLYLTCVFGALLAVAALLARFCQRPQLAPQQAARFRAWKTRVDHEILARGKQGRVNALWNELLGDSLHLD